MLAEREAVDNKNVFRIFNDVRAVGDSAHVALVVNNGRGFLELRPTKLVLVNGTPKGNAKVGHNGSDFLWSVNVFEVINRNERGQNGVKLAVVVLDERTTVFSLDLEDTMNALGVLDESVASFLGYSCLLKRVCARKRSIWNPVGEMTRPTQEVSLWLSGFTRTTNAVCCFGSRGTSFGAADFLNLLKRGFLVGAGPTGMPARFSVGLVMVNVERESFDAKVLKRK